MFEILIIIGIVLTIIGIIRLIIAPANSFLEALYQIWMLDLLFDLLGALIEALGSAFDD